jgi:hypothetical protein
MKTRMVEEREGEDMGPVDWTHPMAADKPAIWREAEQTPDAFWLDNGGMGYRTILKLCMWDGWPYWKPTPAICYTGPLKTPEWAHFNSYGIRNGSILRKSR